jgi:hypothetical protein
MMDSRDAHVADVLRSILQQQTAMLEVQAESVRLQRVVVERLLGGAIPHAASATEPPPREASLPEVHERPPTQPVDETPCAPARVEPNAVRGARYYQPQPSPVRSMGPEHLELMRRLQEMRDASDLILQFGPHKGSTLAQVAMSNPEYIRQLMRAAQRPEVRAAAGRLVQALDAAAEHKPRPHARRAAAISSAV